MENRNLVGQHRQSGSTGSILLAAAILAIFSMPAFSTDSSKPADGTLAVGIGSSAGETTNVRPGEKRDIDSNSDESDLQSKGETALNKHEASASAANSEPKVEPSGLAPAKDAGGRILEGTAEMTELDAGAAVRASKDYRQGLIYLEGNKFVQAADLFKRAGDQFDRGYERYCAEARYAEAQCRRMLGQKTDACRLYQAAIQLFKKYDPKSPYLEASIEQLGNISLTKQTPQMAMAPRKLVGAVNVDQNVTLQGKVDDDGTRLSGRKAVVDVEKKFVKDSVHQCFTEMSCLETAELGSNSTNADNRWVPLLAYGAPAAVNASDDYFSPLIKVRINGKLHNINVDLPGLASSKRTVLLLTDGEKICAIDPVSNDVWLLKMTLSKDGKGEFKFKKLIHKKDRVKKG